MLDSIQSFNAGMSSMPPPPPPGGPQGGALQDAVTEKLAEETGLSTDEIEAGFKDGSIFKTLMDAGIDREDMEAIRMEALTEAVESGEISQDEADEIMAHMEQGPPPPPRGQRAEGMAGSMMDVLSQLTEELGIEDEETLLSIIPEGTSLWQFASENGSSLFSSSDSMFDALI